MAAVPGRWLVRGDQMTEQERDAKRWRILMIMIDEDQVRPMTEGCDPGGLLSNELTESVDRHIDKEIE
jgi:hypothetical protein